MFAYYKCYILIRFDVSVGIDVNKAGKSKECNIVCYCYFLDKGFKFQ